MNIKYLKKIRSRYSYIWSQKGDDNPVLVVADKKKQKPVEPLFNSLFHFIGWYLDNHKSIFAGNKYRIRMRKRSNLNTYRLFLNRQAEIDGIVYHKPKLKSETCSLQSLRS